MTFENLITVGEKFGIPLVALGGVLWVLGRYVAPYVASLIQQDREFRNSIITVERDQRIQERNGFFKALENVNERAEIQISTQRESLTAQKEMVEVIKKMDAKLDIAIQRRD